MQCNGLLLMLIFGEAASTSWELGEVLMADSIDRARVDRE